MECTKDKIYFLIESLRRCDYNATEIHNIIERSWPDECLSLSRIRAICKEFRDETRDSFERKEGSGRHKSDTRTQHTAAVLNMIEDDPTVTIQGISDELEISHTMAQRIIKEDLNKKWQLTKWVPHTLSDGNKFLRVERCQELIDSFTSRISKSNLVTIDEKFFYCRKVKAKNRIGSWVSASGDERAIQTARRSPMEKKFMAIIAVSQRGYHFFKVLPKNQYINSEIYIQFLMDLEVFLLSQPNAIRPENMRLLHDNARPHASRATSEHIESRNIRHLRQPPYSPDVNLCDRFIFPRLEALTKDFQTIEDINQFLSQELPKFTSLRMEKALESMITDMQAIINNGGAYL